MICLHIFRIFCQVKELLFIHRNPNYLKFKLLDWSFCQKCRNIEKQPYRISNKHLETPLSPNFRQLPKQEQVKVLGWTTTFHATHATPQNILTEQPVSEMIWHCINLNHQHCTAYLKITNNLVIIGQQITFSSARSLYFFLAKAIFGDVFR